MTSDDVRIAPDDVDPAEQARCTEPLEDEAGDEYVICQDATGADTVAGGGEYPDRDAPPQAPAPGSVRSGR
jgi:hypothetical protein